MYRPESECTYHKSMYIQNIGDDMDIDVDIEMDIDIDRVIDKDIDRVLDINRVKKIFLHR